MMIDEMDGMNGEAKAFPVSLDGHHIDGGLTKREMFAMAAMQGILANPNWKFSEGWATLEAIGNADDLLKGLDASSDKSKSDKLIEAIEHLRFLKSELKDGFKEGGEVAEYLCNGIDKLLKQLES